jgi:hypothetical protein
LKNANAFFSCFGSYDPQHLLGGASFPRNEAEGFEKSLLSNLIRDETREEPERFFESELA